VIEDTFYSRDYDFRPNKEFLDFDEHRPHPFLGDTLESDFSSSTSLMTVSSSCTPMLE
jgi:hypothetical protein